MVAVSSGPYGEQSSGVEPEMARYRKITFFALVAFVLDILIGGGFSLMSANEAPTTLETEVIRWVALICLAIAGVAYLLYRRLRGHTES
jgi:hypothetical protein